MTVRYDDFAKIRKKRILAFSDMVFALLCNWRDGSLFKETVKNTYTENAYRDILGDILHLYNVETRLLSNSLTVRGPAGAVKDLFAEKLYVIMEETAQEITDSYTRRIYLQDLTKGSLTISSE